MSHLVHLVVKDHENSGHVRDDFFCPACLESRVKPFDHLEILRKRLTTPNYLARFYPPLVNEPACRACGARFAR